MVIFFSIINRQRYQKNLIFQKKFVSLQKKLCLCEYNSNKNAYETRYRFKNKPVAHCFAFFGVMCFEKEPTGFQIFGAGTL